MTKYGPLGDRLARSASPVELSFDEIARLVGGLPSSAYRWQAWWANDPHHVQAAAWLGSGRLAERIDLAAQRVRFSATPVGSDVAVEAVHEPVAAHRRGSTAQRPAARTGHEAWFWEGNVQARIAAHLVQEGWQIIRVADAATRERGDDILARRDGHELVVEVKGYPSVEYADPARSGEVKVTAPTLQAHHWLADAVLKSLRTLGVRPNVMVAIGLPRTPRYERLLAEIAPALRRLSVGVYLVSEDGMVSAPIAEAASSPGQKESTTGWS